MLLRSGRTIVPRTGASIPSVPSALSLLPQIAKTIIPAFVPPPISSVIQFGSSALDIGSAIYQFVNRKRKFLQAIRQQGIGDDAGAAQRVIRQGDDINSIAKAEAANKRLRIDPRPAENNSSSSSAPSGLSADIEMPYLRRRYSRRSRRTPGYFYRRTYRPGWSAQSGLRRRIRRAYAPELKFSDVISESPSPPTFGGTYAFADAMEDIATVSSSANLILLNGIAQNATGEGRIGEKVAIKSLLLRMCIRAPTADEGDIAYSNCVRVMVFIDRQSNGDRPGLGDVLVHTPTIDPALCPMRLSNRARFKVLCDRHFTIHGGTDGSSYFMEFYKKFKKPLVSWYTSTGGSKAEIKSNALWVVFLDDTDPTAAMNSKPFVQTFMSRIRYIDP